MNSKINSYFKISDRGSNFRTELLAGLVTFLTMSYIIFLQPLILSGTLGENPTGMPLEALTASVCIASALGCFLMGIFANYPIALAPGMGENFFFLTVVAAVSSMGLTGVVPWHAALGVVFISGLIFLLLSFLNVRKAIAESISPSMKHAIGSGIGLFIALLGLKNGGIVDFSQNGMSLTGNFVSYPVLIFAVGLICATVLHTLKIKGYILWGILSAALTALICGEIKWQGIVASPVSPMPVVMKFDLKTVLNNLPHFLPFIIIFLFMDVFDTIGTLVGVGAQADLMKNNKLENIEPAMKADSIATVSGTLLGQSTVTAYVESASGVEEGGKTGLTAIVTGIFFLFALFFHPLISMIGNYPSGINPITAPALVLVGALMMKSILNIDLNDVSEAVPAFLVFIGIPFTMSIADGMTLGFIIYPIIKLLTGKIKETGWMTFVLGIVMLIYIIWAKGLLKI